MAVATKSAEAEAPVKTINLDERLKSIRTSSSKLPNQVQNTVVLTAVEATLKEQKSEFTPTAYFAALLSLLKAQSSKNKDTATAVVYLLDLVTPHVPQPLLRSKFTPILDTLAPALTRTDVDAPYLRAALGCLESLLVVQDAQAWALPQTQAGPRRAIAGLLQMALDGRPKVRKRAAEALTIVLQNGPPGPSLDHPAADMCAETALRSFQSLATPAAQGKKQKQVSEDQEHDPSLIHAAQLIKTIASATGGWPSKSLESLCEVLFTVAKSKSEFLTMAAFDVFEAIFEGMAKNNSFDKLPRLLEAVSELQPSQDDAQLLPPWLAVLSRGYDVSSQIEPEETFQQLPELFSMISAFLASSSENIRTSASECLISLLINCTPVSVILDPSIYEEKITEKICRKITELLSPKYQGAWTQVFDVVSAALDAFRWRATPALNKAIAIIGELRANTNFNSNAAAEAVLRKAIRAMGPEAVLEILPLNLEQAKAGQQGRAWMFPLLRDSVRNTKLGHFRAALLPLSAELYTRVQNMTEKTMLAKTLEAAIQQIWASLPGYCDGPLDLREAFDQSFAQQLAELLYKQPEMRNLICKSLQNLVESNRMVTEMEGEENLLAQGRISRADAKLNLDHLATFAPNLVAVLFNVYCETATQYRGPVLSCMDLFLSITPSAELSITFDRVATELNNAIQQESTARAAQNGPKPATKDTKVALSHALMDIVVAISIYLPRETFPSLFTAAATIIAQKQDAQLQKKAYKLIPRLAQSPNGKQAIIARNAELQQLLLTNAEHVMVPAKRDRIAALSEVVEALPATELHFIPSIISEVILCTKETNERARQSAFDLIVQMGEKMAAGGSIDHSRINGAAADAEANVRPANIDEYAVMLSAGLAGTTPHMISATVTALSLVLFHFKTQLSEPAITDMVATMDLFLTSPAREIVRSVLGFVKVCVISLPQSFMLPRLKTLVPSLMGWSKEHKAQFKVKVKNILERMIRKFGVEVIERVCPEEDRKLITNIRKTRERNKRKKAEGAAEGEEGGEEVQQEKRKGKFESEFDEAIYGSDDEEDDDESEGDVDEDGDVAIRGAGKNGKRGQTYIVEDENEPLDLLDRKALARISSTRPVKAPAVPTTKRKVKTDVESGKLLFKEDDGDAEGDEPMDGMDLEQGIDAYVAAIKGRDVGVRGQRNKMKFTNKRDKGRDDEEDDIREDVARAVGGRGRGSDRGRSGDRGRGGRGGGDRGRGSRGAGRGGGRGGMAGRSERRPLGVDKTRGGRVEKSGGRGAPRSRGGGGGGFRGRRS
jgi:ribosomal RNA-processing protein 12